MMHVKQVVESKILLETSSKQFTSCQVESIGYLVECSGRFQLEVVLIDDRIQKQIDSQHLALPACL
jgi:hypothetical protein